MLTWQMIGAERAQFATTLAELPDSDWDKPSLLPGWRVRDVVGHMIATAQMTPPRFLGKMAASGFRFQTMQTKNVHEVIDRRSNGELVELFKSGVNRRTAPPGPTASWLGEAVVHGEDVTRALNGYRDHPIEHLLVVADFYKGSNLLIGAKRRIEGVTLRATDADWQHGTGPEVSGPMIALVMAMTGRKAALDDLTGDGVAALRERP
jgi:uncharacterized protein (TIGR03083 family)